MLFWFIGYQGILPFVGLYSTDILKTSSGTASLAAGMVGIAYAIFAIPSGIVAHRIGRKKTIRISLTVLVVLLAFIFFHDPLTASMGKAFRQYTFWALLFCFGIFWVSVVTNSFPMLWQMSTYQTVGIYTGLYYFSSQLASIISPPITGAFIDFDLQLLPDFVTVGGMILGILFNVCQRHSSSRLGEGPGRRQTHARGSSGDQSDLICE